MSLTRFRVNPHSLGAWMSRNSLLKTGSDCKQFGKMVKCLLMNKWLWVRVQLQSREWNFRKKTKWSTPKKGKNLFIKSYEGNSQKTRNETQNKQRKGSFPKKIGRKLSQKKPKQTRKDTLKKTRKKILKKKEVFV